MNQLNEVEMRCERAVEKLRGLEVAATGTEHWRIQGKIEGVRLVLSYIEEAKR